MGFLISQNIRWRLWDLMTQSIFDKIAIKWIFNKSCQIWTLIYVSHCTRENRSKKSQGSELFNAHGYPPGMLQFLATLLGILWNLDSNSMIWPLFSIICSLHCIHWCTSSPCVAQILVGAQVSFLWHYTYFYDTLEALCCNLLRFVKRVALLCSPAI